MVQRAAHNHIYFLRDIDDRLIGSMQEIKDHSAAYFENTLGRCDPLESPTTVPALQELIPFGCSEAQCTNLQREVTAEEITKTVFGMPLSKSPGPDGYSAEFFRSSWSIVGSDVIDAVQEFFRNGKLLKESNRTTIALIPKQPQACKLGEFKPISCCNLVYKIISRIISSRLKEVLGDCISLNQSAFMKGRSLGENVLLSSELIRRYGKSDCPKSSMLKVDIRKAFDTVSGDFFLKILEAKNFSPLF